MTSRCRTRICREGWYCLLALAAALTWAVLRESNLLLLLSGMFLAAVFLNWRLARATLRGLEVCPRFPAKIHAGEPFCISIEATNTRKRLGSWAVVVQEDVELEAGASLEAVPPVRAFFPFIAARHSPRSTCRATWAKRGRYRLGPLVISTRFPFGLVRSTITSRARRRWSSIRGWVRLPRPGRGSVSERRPAVEEAAGRDDSRMIFTASASGSAAMLCGTSIGAPPRGMEN